MNTYVTKLKFGRPTKYSPSVVQTTRKYLNSCIENDECPFAEELAMKLGINDSTLWNWSKKFEEFSEIYGMLFTLQKLVLKRKGLSGEYVSKAACLLLSADHNVSQKRKIELGANIQNEAPISLTPEQRMQYSEAITRIFEHIYSQPKITLSG